MAIAARERRLTRTRPSAGLLLSTRKCLEKRKPPPRLRRCRLAPGLHWPTPGSGGYRRQIDDAFDIVGHFTKGERSLGRRERADLLIDWMDGSEYLLLLERFEKNLGGLVQRDDRARRGRRDNDRFRYRRDDLLQTSLFITGLLQLDLATVHHVHCFQDRGTCEASASSFRTSRAVKR